MCFASMNSHEANLLNRYISTLYDKNRHAWIQAVVLEQVFLKKNSNFNM